jgi:hypothetical protein
MSFLYLLLSLAFWDRVGPGGPAPRRFALIPGARTGLMVLTHCLSAKREALRAVAVLNVVSVLLAVCVVILEECCLSL